MAYLLTLLTPQVKQMVITMGYEKKRKEKKEKGWRLSVLRIKSKESANEHLSIVL